MFAKTYLNLTGLLLAGDVVAAVEELLQLLLQCNVHINWWREHLMRINMKMVIMIMIKMLRDFSS